MNDDYPKHIKISSGLKQTTESTPKGKRHYLQLRDNIPIADEPFEFESETFLFAPVIINKLLSYRKIPTKEDRVELEVYYLGENKKRLKKVKIYRNITDRQPCLLLILCNTNGKELKINSAYKILSDKVTCRHASETIDEFTAIHWVVKNLRKEVGFTKKELYITKNPPVVGLRSVK